MSSLLVSALLLAATSSVLAAQTPKVIYWNSPAGQKLRTHIPADADYWRLMPTFAVQRTQTYCAVASAITVLNALPIKKPVDPIYAPYAFFTQRDFFTPAVRKVIKPGTVLKQGMTREQLTDALRAAGVSARSIAGDAFTDGSLRRLLKKALGSERQFVLANYYRKSLNQIGGGHWSVLAAYDPHSDRVLILDVAKYKYSPAWVTIAALRQAIDTIDTTSHKPRGLVIVAK
ncbi:MAG: phytochelatin synthase family protein [Gammaproteobacteria bacterium]